MLFTNLTQRGVWHRKGAGTPALLAWSEDIHLAAITGNTNNRERTRRRTVLVMMDRYLGLAPAIAPFVTGGIQPGFAAGLLWKFAAATPTPQHILPGIWTPFVANSPRIQRIPIHTNTVQG